MPTNLAIDDRLIEQAQKLGQHRTKKETVTAALDEYIRRRKQQEIVSVFGTMTTMKSMIISGSVARNAGEHSRRYFGVVSGTPSPSGRP